MCSVHISKTKTKQKRFAYNNDFFVLTPQGEIDAHEDNFKACAQEGQDLLDDEHPASDEVKEKVSL